MPSRPRLLLGSIAAIAAGLLMGSAVDARLPIAGEPASAQRLIWFLAMMTLLFGGVIALLVATTGYDIRTDLRRSLGRFTRVSVHSPRRVRVGLLIGLAWLLFGNVVLGGKGALAVALVVLAVVSWPASRSVRAAARFVGGTYLVLGIVALAVGGSPDSLSEVAMGSFVAVPFLAAAYLILLPEGVLHPWRTRNAATGYPLSAGARRALRAARAVADRYGAATIGVDHVAIALLENRDDRQLRDVLYAMGSDPERLLRDLVERQRAEPRAAEGAASDDAAKLLLARALERAGGTEVRTTDLFGAVIEASAAPRSQARSSTSAMDSIR